MRNKVPAKRKTTVWNRKEVSQDWRSTFSTGGGGQQGGRRTERMNEEEKAVSESWETESNPDRRRGG